MSQVQCSNDDSDRQRRQLPQWTKRHGRAREQTASTSMLQWRLTSDSNGVHGSHVALLRVEA